MQLDALCLCWHSKRFQKEFTLTKLHQAIVSKLWKKEARPVKEHYFRGPLIPDLKSLVPQETLVLETLAFNGLVNAQYSLTTRIGSLSITSSNDQNMIFANANLKKISLLHSSDSQADDIS